MKKRRDSLTAVCHFLALHFMSSLHCYTASASIRNPHGDTSEVLIPGLPLTACHPHYLLHPQWGSHQVVLETALP